MALKFTRLSPLAEIPRPLGGTGLGLLTTGEFEKDPGGTEVVYWKTGLAVEPPPGHYVEICPAGLHKAGWVMADSPIAIDPAFRGEIKVPLLPIDLSVDIDLDTFEGWASGDIGREWPAEEGLEPSTLIARLAVRRLYEPEVVDVNNANKACFYPDFKDKDELLRRHFSVGSDGRIDKGRFLSAVSSLRGYLEGSLDTALAKERLEGFLAGEGLPECDWSTFLASLEEWDYDDCLYDAIVDKEVAEGGKFKAGDLLLLNSYYESRPYYGVSAVDSDENGRKVVVRDSEGRPVFRKETTLRLKAEGFAYSEAITSLYTFLNQEPFPLDELDKLNRATLHGKEDWPPLL